MSTTSLVLPPFQELAFPSEWEPTDDEMFADDDASLCGDNFVLPRESLPQEADNANLTFLGSWKAWKEDGMLGNGDMPVHDDDGDDIIMDVVDRPIGSFLLHDDEIFGGSESCESPTGPLEEFRNGSGMNFDHTNKNGDEHEQFLAPLFQEDKIHDHHHDMTMMMALDDSATTATHYHNDHDSIIGLPFEERYQATIQKLQASMKRSEETRKSLLVKTSKTEKYERLGSVKEILSSIAASSSQVQSLYSTAKRQHSI